MKFGRLAKSDLVKRVLELLFLVMIFRSTYAASGLVVLHVDKCSAALHSLSQMKFRDTMDCGTGGEGLRKEGRKEVRACREDRGEKS